MLSGAADKRQTELDADGDRRGGRMDIGAPETEREVEIAPTEEPVPSPAPIEEPNREPVPA
jgi:hypothetical protein